MTGGPGFRLHPLAAQDIIGIWEYIAEDNPLAARRVREEILSKIRAVVPFPNQGHKRPDLTSRPLRFILVREYLIAYAPEEKPLWVVAGNINRNPTKTSHQNVISGGSALYFLGLMPRCFRISVHFSATPAA